MGTRADFYIKRGGEHEWVGSLEYDGGRIADVNPTLYRKRIKAIKAARTAKEFRAAVCAYFNRIERDLPNPKASIFWPPQWPWLWPTSSITDYVYVWDGELLIFNSTPAKSSYPWPIMNEICPANADLRRFAEHIASAKRLLETAA